MLAPQAASTETVAARAQDEAEETQGRRKGDATQHTTPSLDA